MARAGSQAPTRIGRIAAAPAGIATTPSDATAVTRGASEFRSGQLRDTSGHSPKDESMGMAHGVVMSRRPGKIANLVLARGGLFGIGVFVPNTTGATPRAKDGAFAHKGAFDQETQKVGASWKSRGTSTAGN
jgi:hypothetical protein